MFVVEQHRDVDVALAARGAACPASVQPGETYRGVAAQGVCKAVAEASNVVVAGGRSHVISRSVALSVPRRGWGEAWVLTPVDSDRGRSLLEHRQVAGFGGG